MFQLAKGVGKMYHIHHTFGTWSSHSARMGQGGPWHSFQAYTTFCCWLKQKNSEQMLMLPPPTSKRKSNFQSSFVEENDILLKTRKFSETPHFHSRSWGHLEIPSWLPGQRAVRQQACYQCCPRTRDQRTERTHALIDTEITKEEGQMPQQFQ